MIYITQLIYVNPGKETIFNDFERLAIPIIARYGGVLLFRGKPGEVIEAHMEPPYEIHIVTFPDEAHFEDFKKDPERKEFLHLKEQTVRESILIVGSKMG